MVSGDRHPGLPQAFDHSSNEVRLQPRSEDRSGVCGKVWNLLGDRADRGGRRRLFAQLAMRRRKTDLDPEQVRRVRLDGLVNGGAVVAECVLLKLSIPRYQTG